MPWKAASERAFGNGDNKTFSSLPPKRKDFSTSPLPISQSPPAIMCQMGATNE